MVMMSKVDQRPRLLTTSFPGSLFSAFLGRWTGRQRRETLGTRLGSSLPVMAGRHGSQWVKQVYIVFFLLKHDVYSKQQTAKMKLLPSLFSCVYSRVKLFVFVMTSRRG